MAEEKLLTTISRKTFLVFLNYGVLAVVGLISFYFYTNNMTQTEIGIVQFALAYGGLFSIITDLGFRVSHIKKVSEGQDIGECIGTFLFIQIILIIVFVVSIFASIYIWKTFFGMGFETYEHELMIYLMLGYFVAMQLANIGTQTLSAKVETAKMQSIPLVAALVQFAMTLYVVIVLKDLFLFGMTWVVGALVNLAIASYFLKSTPIKIPNKAMIKSYIIFAIPVAIGSSLAKIPMNIDKVVIQLFWSADDVAIYFSAQRFSTILVTIPMGFSMILLPTFSKLDSRMRGNEIKELVYSTERLLSMIVAPLCAILFVMAYPVITIMSNTGYGAAYLVLQPLAAWALIRSLSIPYTNLLLGIGKPKINAIVSACTVTSIVILDLIFVPTSIFGIPLFGMGPQGAAIATLLAALISTTLFRFFSYKYQKVYLNTAIFRYIFSAVAMGLVLWGLTFLFPATRLYMLILYGVYGMMIYTIILLVTKGLDQKDLDFFSRIINPVLMFDYIKNEFLPKKK